MSTGVAFIKEYRKNRDNYLPMPARSEEIVPERTQYGEINIGWNAGLVEEGRPYYAECWQTANIQVLTLIVSAKGYEGKRMGELDQLFRAAGVYEKKPNSMPPDLDRFTDENGNDFISFNAVYTVEGEVFLDGVELLPYEQLNDLNEQLKTGM